MKPNPAFLSVLILALASQAFASYIWIEGEKPSSGTPTKHSWYHDSVKKDSLSGGDFISHFDASQAAEMAYTFQADEAGDYVLWARLNPVRTKISVSINGAKKQEIDLSEATDTQNIASDGKPDLRFLAWVKVGSFPLKKGGNEAVFHFESENSFHGSLDCFFFDNGSFIPQGTLKPDEAEEHRRRQAEANRGWTPWQPGKDEFGESAIDLRALNERFAGEHGHIIARGESLVRSGDGEEIRFWAVNGPPHRLSGQALADCARMLAKHGVNLVRIHGGVYDGKTGALDDAKVKHVREIVAAMKKEGIYSHLSIYFPLWLKPGNEPGWREGADGDKPAFALLFFEKDFQEMYRGWLKAVLSEKDASGISLADDPALAGVELLNEDSFFFWTFGYQNIPLPQMTKLESMFGKWAAKRYGSAAAALEKWNTGHERDSAAEGNLGFRELSAMFTNKTLRDQDTARFLYETQRSFYKDHVAYLRKLKFRGLVTASNWTTANNDILGPLEKLSYTDGDIIDRHGYYDTNHSGDNAGWSLREGHTYSDRSALRFDGLKPGSEKDFSHPAMDTMTNLKPSMISETTWNRPNRYRGEAPLYYAAYGALQGTDAIVHFALDSADWAVKPGYLMQPWTLMSPTQMAQFPAAALIYRKGLISEGALIANVTLTLADAFALKGTTLAQKANLDVLRQADVTGTAEATGGIDPLVSYVGRTNLSIGEKDAKAHVADLGKYIDRGKQTVTSTSGELKLDYGTGILRIDAPAAQGASGNLGQAGSIGLSDLTITSDLDTAHIVAVSLDGKPLRESAKILLQVMTEEKSTGFTTAESGGVRTITSLGTDPWLIREPRGTVTFKRPDASALTVTALDGNGYPRATAANIGNADEIRLDPNTVYYLVEGK